MSKKKDPNLVLRDKRLRELEFKRRRTVKEVAKLGCAFLDRMVEEDFALSEKIIKLEHYVWNVEIEDVTDEKTGKKISKIIVLPSFTANVDDKTAFGKKMLKLLEKQHRSMTVYRGALEERMELIVKSLTTKKDSK